MQTAIHSVNFVFWSLKPKILAESSEQMPFTPTEFVQIVTNNRKTQFWWILNFLNSFEMVNDALQL